MQYDYLDCSGENQVVTYMCPVNVSAVRLKKMDFTSPGQFSFACRTEQKSRTNWAFSLSGLELLSKSGTLKLYN